MDSVTFTAVESRSLSDAVFEQLQEQILSGELAPGTALPAERTLCARFGVNRAALREALKRLQQLRLVSIRQGGATRVLDPAEHGGPELLVAMVFDRRGRVRPKVVRSLFELRCAIGPDIARLAAERRGETHVQALRDILAEMDGERGDMPALERSNLRLWRVLVEASDNLAYQLMFNTMAQVWSEVIDLVAPILADELSDRAAYLALVRAVEGQKPAAAERAGRRLLTRGASAVIAALGQAGAGRKSP